MEAAREPNMVSAMCDQKHLIQLLRQIYKLDTAISPILQMGKLRLWEVKLLFSCPPALKWWSQDLNPCLTDHKAQAPNMLQKQQEPERGREER